MSPTDRSASEVSSPALAPNSFATIRARADSLSRGERVVADYVLRSPEELLGLSVTDLAARLQVSQATVIRFCQHVGCRGYRDFKIFLARDVGRAPLDIYPNLTPNDDAATVLRKTVHLSLQSLQDTLSTLESGALERASQTLSRAAAVALFGVGGSGGIVLVTQQRLLRIGIPAFACTDPHTLDRISAHLRHQSVAFGITHSGRTAEIVKALGTAQQQGATTITLTNYPKSPVTRCAEIVLLTGAAHTPLASEAGASRIVQLAAIDALCARIVLLKRRLPKQTGRELKRLARR